jgi:hypothetical protein
LKSSETIKISKRKAFLMNKYISAIFIFLLVALTLPLVHADLGPKPTVSILVTLNGGPVDAPFTAKLFECQKENRTFMRETDLSIFNFTQFDSEKNCFWRPADLAWGGDCKNSICTFSYMPPDEFKLAAYLLTENKLYLTQQMHREAFNSFYEVDFHTDGSSTLKETTNYFFRIPSETRLFFLALLLTIAFEVGVATLFMGRYAFSKRLLWFVALGSVITLPIVWFLLPIIVNNGWFIFLFGEAFAIVFEAYFIFFTNRKEITLKRSFTLSIAANAASLLLGTLTIALMIIFSFSGGFSLIR